MASINGLGPHGERAERAGAVSLAESEVAAARRKQYRVAIVMHTLDSDWSRLQLAGIVGTLGDTGCTVSEVVDCHFDAQTQTSALETLSQQSLDAIISFPVANTDVAEAHRKVSRAGIHLVLLDNVPTGLLPGNDYVSLISSDNFGLGLIGAQLLSEKIGSNGTIGILTYNQDFYAINEREIAFRRWVKMHRPDLTIVTESFDSPETAGQQAQVLIENHQDVAGLFVVWDTPALDVLKSFKNTQNDIYMTTVDLGQEISLELAKGTPLIGIAAQQPYLLGVTTAQTAVLAMLGQMVPRWIALPGLEVTQSNVVTRYQEIWRAPAPQEVLRPD
ncbi:putative ABC sugar transporter, periplasmic ligand binding protein [Vibrio nigripulchritudo SO65]|uniref:substrate-binding domain-containing protein n=1 Tax=Vibrio nigripulchritudo TaxID=28173 RepID=UPI0003B20883|nr:substrate-binding domain-containing protein [Vibrio nigripulchritudo]CCN36106.1 putative ABC sugar transporter, periplasmic ligand binding protein [Vibrio nigripulchritudo AM115]CCN44386.1 putative ABC sugar transporter, periplasmic ligand binding protein [Vibrio nigripulchritudo FTn2]CCN68123.1 putative ABC sugar transporter, periplasmic ligand binding protein [Vibrio nigripulchritudo POn4]CCN75365.1 putative ABC sugar transporter, periplasmic ligand binding protein [Vibrio nigripulchritudo